MASSSRPVFVLAPGAAQNPSHYAYLLHLLQSAGYPTLSALLPSTGTSAPISAQDDTDYIRSRMLLPVLDIEKHNVILITHSYSGMPGSAAARGLGKAERAAQGKETSVLGQIFIASILPRGGDGMDVVGTFGGQMPPHIRVEEAENLTYCDDPKPPLYQDVSPVLADVAAQSCVSPCYSSWKTPCPACSWDTKDFQGRCAYIRTANDQCIPYNIQTAMVQGTEQEWIVRDIESGHSPQLSQPEKLSQILLELAKQFEEL